MPTDEPTAEELKARYDIGPDAMAEIIRKRREREEQEARELFGDRPPFPIPDPDTDA
jgi:putative SOS response-associated peptidase YedK